MSETAADNKQKEAAKTIRCHYEVLGVERTADDATIKKAHRKLALKLHPDKNVGGDDDDDTHHEFLAVQQAYECLSDAVERKWYDEHRDAILKGWTTTTSATGDDGAFNTFLFDVIPFIYAGCYSGYDDDDPKGFYAVYRNVFEQVLKGELGGEEEGDAADSYLSHVQFGDSQSPWDTVSAFYQAWESFASTLNYAWADPYDTTQAENRRVRRAMMEENKKARRAAKRARTDDILQLVRFVKRRDPRVRDRQSQLLQQSVAQKLALQQQAAAKKRQQKQAREEWRRQAEIEMAEAEEQDRLAGRVRLADLEDDDYDYGGKKGKKGRKKNKKKQQSSESSASENDDSEKKMMGDDDDVPSTASKDELVDTGSVKTDEDGLNDNNGGVSAVHDEDQDPTVQDNSSFESSSSSDDEEPEAWRCECCKKDFKSQGQMDNHLKSKKHKVAWKKYEAKVAELEAELLDDMLEEVEIGGGEDGNNAENSL